MEDKKNKTKVVHLAEDGLPIADVSHYTATPEHLNSYHRAADELYKFKVPALLDARDKHSYLLFGLMDGTGNDAQKDPLHATNVARFETQALKLKNSGFNVDVVYEAGPGTQKNFFAENIDAATGRTSESIAERTYQKLVNRAQEIYRLDPDAKIAIHAEGFSRGASQVPLLARMIHERGIPNLDRPEYVPDEYGKITKTYPHFHQAPGHTPMSVGLYDPVPTGAMTKLDRRLPPSVVSGFQINAADEKRGTFPVDRIIPAGLSEDGRFLSVSVAGAHSDIGGSYLRNGLGTRSQNLMTDYHNALFNEPLLQRLPETYDPRMNVIHRSEEGGVFKYLQYISAAERDTPKGEVTKLMPDDGARARYDPIEAAVRSRPEPMSPLVADVAQRASPAVRSIPRQMTALPAEDAVEQWFKQVGKVEVQPYQPPAQLSPGAKVMAAAAVAGIAASVVDAKASADRTSTLLSQDNPLAAQSELTHYAARGTGGWIGGASAGLVATAASTGPGVVGFIVIGGAAVAGAHVGEHVATVADSYRTFIQKDTQGVLWHSNGLQWVRKDLGDLTDDGQNHAVKQDFSADPEKADELNYKASRSATELAIGKLQSPRNPYSQPASESDPVSQRSANWERNSQTGTWTRTVVEGFEQRGVPITRIEQAGAERAAELDRASQQVIQENIANGPAPMAARFEVVHRSEGWERFGGVPPSIAFALKDDSLVASDGKLYQLTAEGQWQRNGESVVAAGNLHQELDSTRAALQPQLAQHQEQVAAIPPRQPPTLEDIERNDLMATLRVHKVEPSAEQLEAALEAVRRTQQEHGINPLTTSLHLGLNAKNKFDIDSPIEHIGRDADGANRVQARTSPLEVQLAMLDLRSPPPTTPEAPELRIANLSPQQQAALEQVVREANRLGLQRDDVQATARQAIADATDGVPDIVTTRVDADRLQPAPKPEALREVDAPGPVIARAAVAVAEPVAEKTQDGASERNFTEAGRAPAGSMDGVQQTATAAPLAAVIPPPVRETENEKTVVEPGSPSAPKQAETATVAVAPAETVKPAAVVAKPPEQQAPAPQPAPDAPAPTTPPSAPHTAPVAAEATPTPDTPTATSVHPAPPVAPLAAEAEPAPDDGTLRRGDRGNDVEMLQFRLQRVGYTGSTEAPLQRNGQFDAATEQAVRQLQRDHGLPETGSVDPETVQALAVAQHAKIESRKTENVAVESPTAEKNTKSVEPAAVVNAERMVDATAASLTSPLPDERPTETSRRVEPSVVPGEEHSKEREHPVAQVGDKATPAPTMDTQDIARLSPADQAMFAKIRAGAPGHISDETVAAAMLSAKRDKIHDADSIAQVGVANGKLWVGSTTPGFYGAVSLSEQPPAIQDTLRETQAVNQQREQQLAQEASQRNPDDPSRGGPKM